VGGEVVEDHIDSLAVGARRPTGLDGPQGVVGSLLLPDHAPHGVVTHRVAGVELPNSTTLVIVGPQALGLLLGRPAAAGDGVDEVVPAGVEV